MAALTNIDGRGLARTESPDRDQLRLVKASEQAYKKVKEKSDQAVVVELHRKTESPEFRVYTQNGRWADEKSQEPTSEDVADTDG